MRRAARLAFVPAALLLCLGAAAQESAFDRKFSELLRDGFRAKGDAGLDRLAQDELQAACTAARDRLPEADNRRYMQAEAQRIRWPADGSLLGDWRRGERIAQDGRGMTWSDRAGQPGGGSCYGCHDISPKELSHGTLGPSLAGYGREHGNTPQVQRYVFGHIYDAKAYSPCSAMPRFGTSGALTEQQIRDLVALLLDPASPVNGGEGR